MYLLCGIISIFADKLFSKANKKVHYGKSTDIIFRDRRSYRKAL